MIRLIIWFFLFHFGIDFWLFPNYFIDSNNPLDSFVPFLEVTRRDDILDFRMCILRLASVAAIVFCAREVMHSEKTMDDVLNTFQDVSNDVFEWGQNKFLGIPDNSQALQHKKSAREIFAEAFMDDATFKTNTRFVDFADEAEIKAAYEKELKARMQAAENEEEPAEVVDAEEVDVLDSLTMADEDADDEETAPQVEQEEAAADPTGDVQEEANNVLDLLTPADDEEETAESYGEEDEQTLTAVDESTVTES